MVENMDRIVDAEAIPALVSVLGKLCLSLMILLPVQFTVKFYLAHPNDELKRESARALGNLAANIEFGDMILREDALPYLLPMLRSEDTLCQRMAAFALCSKLNN
jgi:hypothetical protein